MIDLSLSVPDSLMWLIIAIGFITTLVVGVRGIVFQTTNKIHLPQDGQIIDIPSLPAKSPSGSCECCGRR